MTLGLSPTPFAFAKVARQAVLGLASVAFLCAAASVPALAKHKPPAKEKAQASKGRSHAKTDNKSDEKKDQKNKAGKDAKSGAGKDSKTGKDKDAKSGAGAKTSTLVGSYGDWGVYTAQDKDKTCYALASPKDRQPSQLARDPAYVFISTRPGEGVRHEVAVSLGFPTKDNGAASADIDGDAFELVTKGANAWVKNPANEKELVETLKGGAKLVVKAPSSKGNVTTDTYSLKGVSQALERAQKECQ
ncbi:MAG: hypothetical protein HYS06_06820 [Methylocystis sp.]|nr:hypothetical protein [Methylocystis sp.]